MSDCQIPGCGAPRYESGDCEIHRLATLLAWEGYDAADAGDALDPEAAQPFRDGYADRMRESPIPA